MKNLAVAICLLIVAIACKKDSPKKLERTIEEGTWKVELFSEDGVDQTHHFVGYVFDFKEDGSVTASNGSLTITGTWSTNDNVEDDSSRNIHFVLSFPSTNHFEDLSDDWHLKTMSDSKVSLEDISGGDGSIDLLTFVR